MKIKDKIVEFDGFVKSIRSYCHVRLAYNPEIKDSKFVVICSQLPKYHGTSVTNAFESVAKTLLEDSLLGTKCFDTADEEWSKWLIEVASGSLPVQARTDESILKEFREFLQARIAGAKVLSWTDIFESSRFIWIERYPPGVGIRGDVEDLARVELADRSGTPSWNHYSFDELFQVTGYNAHELLCPVEELPLAANEFLSAGAK